MGRRLTPGEYEIVRTGFVLRGKTVPEMEGRITDMPEERFQRMKAAAAKKAKWLKARRADERIERQALFHALWDDLILRSDLTPMKRRRQHEKRMAEYDSHVPPYLREVDGAPMYDCVDDIKRRAEDHKRRAEARAKRGRPQRGELI